MSRKSERDSRSTLVAPNDIVVTCKDSIAHPNMQIVVQNSGNYDFGCVKSTEIEYFCNNLLLFKQKVLHLWHELINLYRNMKRILLSLAFLSCLLCCHAADAPYCSQSAFGYGAKATGGGDAKPTLVSSASEFKNALKGSNKVIVITKSFTVTSMINGQDMKNITILGLPGVTLSSNETNAGTSGILFIKRTSNIIIRNLTFVGPGAYDVDGNDLLCFQDVTDAWVDHCDFQDGLDGNFDNKGATDNVTVSWCRFHYLKKPIPGGSGGSDDHRYSNLLGSSASDKPSDGTYNFTWAYCWWDYGCKQRMVRCRNASRHFLNCYWDTSVADYYIGPENVDAYIEGCWMAKLKAGSRVFYENFSTSSAQIGAKFVNTYYEGGNLGDVTKRNVVVPSYKYTALNYTEAKQAVSNTTCGAGATLKVTEKGEVSSSCNSGDNTDPTPEQPDPEVPVTGELTWSADDSDISDLGTLTAPVTLRGLTIAAAADKNVVVDANAKTFTDGNTTLSFAHRIKMGGSMNENSRYLSFNVGGNCNIEVYCISANSSNTRPLHIATGTWNNVAKQADVTGTEVNRVVYQYQGGATTIFVGSGNSAINILGINVSGGNIVDALPAIEAVTTDSELPAARKIMIEGKLFILTPDNHLYTPLGVQVR